MDNYAAVATPNAQRNDHGGASGAQGGDMTARRPSAAAAFFGLRDDREVSGDPVDDPELEAAADEVDTSLRFFCVTQDAVIKYLPVVVSISIGAYFGVGLRILLTEFVNRLSYRDNGLLQLLGGSFFLPNVVGCFVMGLAVRCKPLVRDRFGIYVTGVTTGFCGCCTTFASWDVGVAAKIVHGLIIPAIVMIGVQIACAFASFRVGFHVAEALIAYFAKQSAPFPKPPVDAKQLTLDLDRSITAFEAVHTQSFSGGVTRRMASTRQALIAARDASKELVMEITQDEHLQPSHAHQLKGWAIVAVVLFLWLWIPPFVGFDNYPSSRLFGLALAPFGACLRYYFSLFNSQPRCKDFPLYTFIPNVSASVLSCLLIMIGSAAAHHGGGSYRTYEFLGDGGLIVGFCGSLSTVSTWINELDTLASRKMSAAYWYAFVSILIAQVASVFLLGIFALASDDPLIV